MDLHDLTYGELLTLCCQQRDELTRLQTARDAAVRDLEEMLHLIDDYWDEYEFEPDAKDVLEKMCNFCTKCGLGARAAKWRGPQKQGEAET